MKAKASIIAVLVAVLSATFPINATGTPSKIPVGFKVDSVSLRGEFAIRRGDSMATVRSIIGSPQRQIGPNVWAYNGFYPAVEEDRGCSVLVITFSGEVVTDMKVVNPAAVKVLASGKRAIMTDKLIAKK